MTPARGSWLVGAIALVAAACGDGAGGNGGGTGIWRRTITVRDVLSTYRARYTPKAGSPAIDKGDPAGGSGNDIGAVGAGAANAMDKFGVLP